MEMVGWYDMTFAWLDRGTRAHRFAVRTSQNPAVQDALSTVLGMTNSPLSNGFRGPSGLASRDYEYTADIIPGIIDEADGDFENRASEMQLPAPAHLGRRTGPPEKPPVAPPQ